MSGLSFFGVVDGLSGPWAPGERRRRARLLVSVALLLGAVGSAFGVANVALVDRRAGAGMIAGAALVMLSIGVLRWGRSIKAAGHFMMLLLTLILFYFARVKGGLVSTVTVFAPAIVFLAVLIVGRRGGLVWAVVGLVGAIVHYRFDAVGVMTTEIPLNRIMYTATAGSSFIIFWGFAHLFESSRNRAFAVLEQKNEEIARQNTAVMAMAETIRKRNAAMKRILDNVSQGLLTVDREGRIEGERSRVLDEWFAPPDPEMPIWAYIGRMDPKAGEWLALGLDQVLDGLLPLELALYQLPRVFRAGDGTFALEYQPIIEGDTVVRLLVVVTDLTDALEKEALEARGREQLSLFQSIIRDRGGFAEFREETRRIVERITLDQPADVWLRDVHTIKGNCALYGATSVADECHDVEQSIEAHDRAPNSDDVTRIQRAWSHLEETVAPLLGIPSADIVEVDRTDLDEAVQLVRSKASTAAADLIESWTAESTDARLRRVKMQAEGLAKRLNKDDDVRVVVEGNHLRLDADKWSSFWSAFVHVLRNSIDHGLEAVDERRANGKSTPGTLRVRTYTDGDEFVVDVADDGRGIDWDAVAAKAAAMGLPADDTRDLQSALFAPGLTTKARATTISGRGMGMSAIQHEVEALGGQTVVQSERGRGTSFQFRVPRSQMR